MKFENVPNQQYTTTCGKVIYDSRSHAVCVAILRANPKDTAKLQVLATVRGSAMTHPGKYCMPCGYLDWNESIEEAAAREVFEETDLEIDWSELEHYETSSDPKKFRQNITSHFVHYYTGEKIPSNNNADENEVDIVEWIDYEEVVKLDWAFDHKDRILKLISYVNAEKE